MPENSDETAGGGTSTSDAKPKRRSPASRKAGRWLPPTLIHNPLSRDERARRVTKLLDPELLESMGYDAESRVFLPDKDDPSFGWARCERVGCGNVGWAHPETGLCKTCDGRLRECSGGLTLKEFKASSRHPLKPQDLCRVCRVHPDHLRPAEGQDQLCRVCSQAAKDHRLDADSYVRERLAGEGPRPGFGNCRAPSCTRLAAWTNRLCTTHKRRWYSAGSPAPDSKEFASWIQDTDPKKPHSKFDSVSLAELEGPLRDEILLVLQIYREQGRKLRIGILGLTVRQLIAAEVASVFDFEPPGKSVVSTVAAWRRILDLALTTRDEEIQRQVWRLPILGYSRGTLRFSRIKVAALNESARHYSDRKAGEVNHHNSLVAVVESVVALSETLEILQAEDPRYASTAAWDQGVMRKHLRRLESLSGLPESDPSYKSPKAIAALVTRLSKFLRAAREYGLTAEGNALAGLPQEFMVPKGVTEKHARSAGRRAHRRDLPHEVVLQLLSPDALDELELRRGLAARVSVELQFAGGRRTAETCSLRANAITVNEDGWAELEVNCAKGGPQGLVIPIDPRLVGSFKRQQQEVIRAFPNTPPSELALFPSDKKNPDGTKGFRAHWLVMNFRVLRESLGELIGPDGADYDRKRVVPYAARHTFAQRYADAGVPIDHLQHLLGHKHINSTREYYTVSRRILQEHQERVAELMIGADGQSLEDPRIEAAIRRTGALPVPLGGCFNARNIATGGGSCPLDGRCVGCKHLRTDVRWLPVWEMYYEHITSFQARLDSRDPHPDAEPWALEEARPSDRMVEEVSKIRRQLRAQLRQLPAEDQERMEKLLRLQAEARASHVWANPAGAGSKALRVRSELQPWVKEDS